MDEWTYNLDQGIQIELMLYILMGGATDFKVGVQNRIRERSERKKICTPTFPNVVGTSK